MEKLEYKNNVIVLRNQRLVKFVVYSIPLILLLEWLHQFELMPNFPPLVLKAISIIVFFKFLLTKTFKTISFGFKKPLIFFLILNLVYSFFSSEIIESLYYSIRILYWILGTFTFYALYQSFNLTVKDLKLMIKSVVIIGSFFTIILLLQLSKEGEYDNASAYLLLWCLPLLLLFGYSKTNRLLMAIALIAIFMTIKRGAMIASIVAFYVYVFSVLYISKSVKHKIRTLLFCGFFSVIVSVVVFFNWDIVNERLSDKTGSGRDEMYMSIIENYTNGDLQNLIFGYGLNSVQEFTKTYYGGIRLDNKVGVAAHSDWIQYIHDFGVFGIIFMVWLHIIFLKLIKYNYRVKSYMFPIALSAYSIFFLTTIYSFILNTPNAFYFGIVIAVINIETNKIKNQQIV